MSHQSYFTLPESFLEELIQRGLDALPDLVQFFLNAIMLAERQEYLRAAPYQRTVERRDHANGFKPKTLKTRLGPIELRVPQVRKGPFYPSVLTKGQRSERAMMLALAEMYVLGAATRKVAVLVEKILGVKISSSAVSQAAQGLDEILQAWRERRLDEQPTPYLYLDGSL